MKKAIWRILYNQILSGAYVAPTALPTIPQLNTDYTTASNKSPPRLKQNADNNCLILDSFYLFSQINYITLI